ncbi:Hypothetical predicted protein [Mytilus galloprovincialis]|uniref:Endonuclease/exonuclease/phosphatase domain-containing protein n=1 Tax=Mytilus galloprovincialis TaxID=29158 RepID=A0A8B6BMA7_MYTGA|nr:Hypothetical predicted protein [Mytilus galloprovincialis]
MEVSGTTNDNMKTGQNKIIIIESQMNIFNAVHAGTIKTEAITEMENISGDVDFGTSEAGTTSVEGVMWINITDKGGKFQFNACVCYLPPVDSTRNVDAQEFYDTVLSQIHTYGKTGLFFMCGDLNSRCADMEDFIPGVDDIIERDVIDYVSNAYGEILCDFLINSNCCILNGRNTKRNNYTYVSTRGSSVVDYCIVPYENVCRFTDFEVSTMSELMQNYNLFDSVDQCVSKPDHSLLAWNMCLDKLTKSHRDENKSKETEVKKFDFSNIPSSFFG